MVLAFDVASKPRSPRGPPLPGLDNAPVRSTVWSSCQVGVTKGMSHQKPHLPEKICQVCGKPFAWRKKWAKDWEQVRYCSERCRRSKSAKSVNLLSAPSRKQP
ncbi:MAG: DUF2256 domain-containing protein [Pirellula sp.]